MSYIYGAPILDVSRSHTTTQHSRCCVVVCDLETSRMGAPYIYDISHLRVKIRSSSGIKDGQVCGRTLIRERLIGSDQVCRSDKILDP